MNQVLGIDSPRPNNPVQLLLEETKTRGDIYPPTLSEIQREPARFTTNVVKSLAVTRLMIGLRPSMNWSASSRCLARKTKCTRSETD